MRSEIIEILPLGAFIIDQNHQVIQWNGVIEEWSRVKREHIEGRRLGETFNRFNEPRYHRFIDDCFAQGGSPVVFSPALHQGLLPTYKPDGSLRTQVITLSPFQESGMDLKCLVAVQDITDLTQTSLNLYEANRRIALEVEYRIVAEKRVLDSIKQEAISKLATERMKAVTQVVGGVAHHFNNLLQIVLGNLSLLRQESANEFSVSKRIKPIEKAVASAASITRSLLAYSSKEILLPEGVDLNEFVADNLPAVKALFGDSIAVETNYSEHLPKISVDVNALGNVIMELAKNSKTAMQSGDVFTLQTETTERRIEGLRTGRYVILTASDTGGGMGEEIAARAFEPFFTTAKFGQGVGLGLSMVYGFCKQSGGLAIIQSELGKGTSVELLLPQAEVGVH